MPAQWSVTLKPADCYSAFAVGNLTWRGLAAASELASNCYQSSLEGGSDETSATQIGQEDRPLKDIGFQWIDAQFIERNDLTVRCAILSRCGSKRMLTLGPPYPNCAPA